MSLVDQRLSTVAGPLYWNLEPLDYQDCLPLFILAAASLRSACKDPVRLCFPQYSSAEV